MQTISHNYNLKATIGIQFDEMGPVDITFAFCRHGDRWVRREGTIKCLGRFKCSKIVERYQHITTHDCRIQVHPDNNTLFKQWFLDIFQELQTWPYQRTKDDTLMMLIDRAMRLSENKKYV